jgi:hypothetical protein
MLVGRKATRLITLATLVNVAVQVTMAIAVPAVMAVDGARLAATILVASASAQAVVLVSGARTIARRLRSL